MKRWAHSSLMGGVGVGLNLLHEKDCEKIHEASLEVLHDWGAYFDSETAREVLRDHGCWEDADGCTHFPCTLVESALEAVPTEFVHRGRTSDDDIHMTQDQVYASNLGEGTFTHDLETGGHRSIAKQDAVDTLRAADSLDNIHVYNRAIGPQDIPSESASMRSTEVAFCYTSKLMHLVSDSPFQTKKMTKMAETAIGGKEELKRRPCTAFNHTTISPFRISHEVCENTMIVAEAGLLSHILVMVQQGATPPISYAGSVAVYNADFLAFNTLLQCANRDSPILYGASVCTMNMKKGLSLVAVPEVFVFSAVMARMLKYYNISSYTTDGQTDSIYNDAQAGAERASDHLMTALADASVLFGQGMLGTGLTFDIPTLLVDDEIIDYVLRMLAGFKVDATILSTDLIKGVGPFGTYLAEMNTSEHLGDLSTYNLMNRRNYDTWAASGKPDLYGQARGRAKEILATHKRRIPSSPEQVRAIRNVPVDAEGELGIVNLWKGKEEKRFIDNDLY